MSIECSYCGQGLMTDPDQQGIYKCGGCGDIYCIQGNFDSTEDIRLKDDIETDSLETIITDITWNPDQAKGITRICSGYLNMAGEYHLKIRKPLDDIRCDDGLRLFQGILGYYEKEVKKTGDYFRADSVIIHGISNDLESSRKIWQDTLNRISEVERFNERSDLYVGLAMLNLLTCGICFLASRTAGIYAVLCSISLDITVALATSDYQGERSKLAAELANTPLAFDTPG